MAHARTIGIFANRTKPYALAVTDKLVEMLMRHDASVFVDAETAEAIDRPELAQSLDELPTASDLLCILGGDGTLLGAARRFAAHDIPLLGINIGHLGFLTEAEPQDLDVVVSRVLAGDYHLERRMMIHTCVMRQGKCVHQTIGLNDAGIGKGSFARMISVSIYVDDEFYDEFTGDGLIVSTPTGSTAYSLSCGGPIVVPHMDLMILTPICAHKLVARPCVISGEQKVRVVVSATHRDLGLTVDGQVGFALQSGDEVIVERANYYTTLVRWNEKAFFTILQNKLGGD